MRSFISVVPLSVLGFAVAVVASLALSRPVARTLRTRRTVAALLLFGFGVVIAATLVPDADAMKGIASDGTCDVSRIGLAPMRELTRISTISLNVLLFMPLGVAVGLLPRTRAAALVTIMAVSLTFVVEGLQLVVTALGRGCQTADMVDNSLGLIIGIVIGTLARPVFGSARGSRRL